MKRMYRSYYWTLRVAIGLILKGVVEEKKSQRTTAIPIHSKPDYER